MVTDPTRSGYSGTPLWKKLGLKPGQRVHFRHAPENYLQLVSPMPEGISQLQRLSSNLDLIHCFSKRRSALVAELPQLIQSIRQNGMIWVSWPKKSSGVTTDITEGVIREVALPLGLVDIKVCAVDETWSALKMVIRKSLRR